eukprot:TRINITY_DN3504_c0_g1_i2.p1 TRINITY_DN3504_c0_g1~~TRINITY_DN3504_c0_g1_i2.p1  ORF type:complete len:229 (+),score=41.45 TRINITY_DN3504_c0_g1_i2:349-1035(+)
MARISDVRKKMPFTHFLSIPLNDADGRDYLPEKVEAFFADVEKRFNEKPPRGYDPSIRVQPQQMHLTILMLKIFTDEELVKVKKVLASTQSTVYDLLDTRSLVVSLAGVEYMNDDPTQVNVLYIKVKNERLQKVCRWLVERFMQEGLAEESTKSVDVLLHATLYNTRFRKKGLTAKEEKRIPFDATQIINSFGSHSFGEYQLKEIQLSKRGEFDEENYYKCEAKILLP